MDPLPSNVFVAIATVMAAVIAGIIAFVSLTLTKEQKTSEFRQAWIDGLRQDLSEYLASTRAMARTYQEIAAFGPKYSEMPFTMPQSQVGAMRQNAASVFYRIKLRLNPDEPEHIELLRLLSSATEQMNQAFQAQNTDPAPIFRAIEAAADHSRPVLKAEWRRVKQGEPQFRNVRNWLVPVVFLLCAAFVWLLMSVKIAA